MGPTSKYIKPTIFLLEIERRQTFSSLKDREALYFAFMGDTCLNTCSGVIRVEKNNVGTWFFLLAL